MTNPLKTTNARLATKPAASFRWIASLLALLVLVAGCSSAGGSSAATRRSLVPATQPASEPRVDVIFWFDTEDYLLPADDDAAKRLAEMLAQRRIRATFKVVG